MRTIIATVIVALTLPAALAGERHGDAAIGALTGAVVLGPVGLIAGAVVGYTAGPSIARSWRGSRHHPRSRAHAAKSSRVASQHPGASAKAAPGEVTPARPAPGAGGPPAQGFD